MLEKATFIFAYTAILKAPSFLSSFSQSPKRLKIGKHYSTEPTKASIKLKKLPVIPEAFCDLGCTIFEPFYNRFETARQSFDGIISGSL